MVQMLLQTPGVQLMDFPQHEAYGAPLCVPGPGHAAARRGRPGRRRAARRRARWWHPPPRCWRASGTHPALLQLFAQAGQTLHSGAGWFNRAREFPNTHHSELPIAPEADRAINEPVPLLQRYLPFWIANLVERMWLVLGILLAALLPLSRIVPPLYQFRVRSRVFRWYGRLREIETDMESGQLPTAALSQALDQLEAQVEKVSVPLSYADELYALRNHIQLVRQRLPTA